MPRIGPIVMTVAGDVFEGGCRIGAFVWEGQTSSGDTITVTAGSGDLLWACRAEGSQTYEIISFGLPGLHLPTGFRLSFVSNGRLLAYLVER